MSIGEELQFFWGEYLDMGIFSRTLGRVQYTLQNLTTLFVVDQVDVVSRSIIPVRQPIAPAALASSPTSTVRQVIPRFS